MGRFGPGGEGGADRGGLLLEPVIADSGARPVQLYSSTASFMVAFFGGGLPLILLSAMNSAQLRRLPADIWFYLLGGLFFVGLTVVGAYAAATGTEIAALQLLGDGSRGHRALNRLFALLFFGAVYLRHRRFYRAANMMGLEPLSPWGPAIGAIVMGSLIIFLVATLTVLVVRPPS